MYPRAGKGWHSNDPNLGATGENRIPYHILGVDNVIRRYSAEPLPGNTNVDAGKNVWPEYPDRAGYNHVIRMSGAHEFIPAGMPHPDSNQRVAAEQRAATPYTPPAQQGGANTPPASPSSPVMYDSPGQLMPVESAANYTSQTTTAKDSGSGLLLIALAALGLMAGVV